MQFFNGFRLSKRLRKVMHNGHYSVTFECVVKACAGHRQGRWHVTWVTPRMMRTFAALMSKAFCTRSKCGMRWGEMIGGFGIALGRVFFGESRFSREGRTSKFATYAPNWHLKRWGYALSDVETAPRTVVTWVTV